MVTKIWPKNKILQVLGLGVLCRVALGHYLKTNRQREKLVSEEAIGWYAWSRGASK